MDFVLYSTFAGYQLKDSTRHDYHDLLRRTGLAWYIKDVKLFDSGTETSATFVTLNSLEDLIKLAEEMPNELIVNVNSKYPELEIYDDYRE